MLHSPLRIELDLRAEDFQRLGVFAVRFSHIEHTIANCLRTMLDMSMEEAIVMVFPLKLETKLQKLDALREIKKISAEAETALTELTQVVRLLMPIRNTVIHGIINYDETRGHLFHLRNKKSDVALTEVQEAEQLTIYAVHAAISLRLALGPKHLPGERHPLPDKPEIPAFLQKSNSTRKKSGEPRPPRRRSSHP